MSHTGFITLHRRLANWEWYTKPNHMFLFVHMLLKANHKKRNWQGIEIERGSFITSVNTLSIETKLTPQQIRTILKNLKKTGEINTRTNKQSTYVSICNYDTYQNIENKLTNELTNDQQTPNKRLTTNNNDNNNNNDKNKKRVVKKIIHPTIQEVIDYFIEKGYSEESARRAFEFYNVADWHDSKGNKVKNWKQKMNSVWFKDENKEKHQPEATKLHIL